MSKIAKITILAKNSNFHSMAGSVRESDIWPEMSPWGVLEPFCTRIRYLNSFRSNFKQFWKNRFFEIFDLWVPPKMGRRIFYGPGKCAVEVSTGPNTSKLFPEKNDNNNFASFFVKPWFCGFSSGTQKHPLNVHSQNRGYVSVFGYHDVVFQKLHKNL